MDNYRQYSAIVEFDEHPRVKAGDVRKVSFTLEANHRLGETRKFKLKLKAPSTWKVEDCPRTISVDYPQHAHGLWG